MRPGRALGIVPRMMAKEGYVDLGHDDYEAGTMLHRLEVGALGVKHRTVPPSQYTSESKHY
jgi:hypothetical protein